MAKRKRKGQTTLWPKEREKERQHYGQKKEKRTNNDLQIITQITTDRATRTSLKTGGELRCSESKKLQCTSKIADECQSFHVNPLDDINIKLIESKKS